jgi:hypothetical protein
MARVLKTSVDVFRLAQRCRAVALQRYIATSCLETTQLFQRAAFHLGLQTERMVCQASAYAPKLAAQIHAGTFDKSTMGQPGVWGVAVGVPRYPGDFVGRIDVESNRFVGHVVCCVEDHLVDPSIDQMSRPNWEMPITETLICPISATSREAGVIWTETKKGVLVKYVLYPDIEVPPARQGKILERLAVGIAKELSADA